jgi:hypothetical protein
MGLAAFHCFSSGTQMLMMLQGERSIEVLLDLRSGQDRLIRDQSLDSAACVTGRDAVSTLPRSAGAQTPGDYLLTERSLRCIRLSLSAKRESYRPTGF